MHADQNCYTTALSLYSSVLSCYDSLSFTVITPQIHVAEGGWHVESMAALVCKSPRGAIHVVSLH